MREAFADPGIDAGVHCNPEPLARAGFDLGDEGGEKTCTAKSPRATTSTKVSG